MFKSRVRLPLALLAFGLLMLIVTSLGQPATADSPRQEGTAVPLIKQPDDTLPDAPGGGELAPPDTSPTEVPGGSGDDPLEPSFNSGDEVAPGGPSDQDDPTAADDSNDSEPPSGPSQPSRPDNTGGGGGGFLCFSPALALLALGAIGLFDHRLLKRRRDR